jgi:hypothetical protein
MTGFLQWFVVDAVDAVDVVDWHTKTVETLSG